MQDFPERTPIPKGGRSIIIWPIFLENRMKMNKFWSRGPRPSHPLDAPLEADER